jgi:hypothetical protein
MFRSGGNKSLSAEGEMKQWGSESRLLSKCSKVRRSTHKTQDTWLSYRNVSYASSSKLKPVPVPARSEA